MQSNPHFFDHIADDQDDVEENEASVKLEAAAPLAHLEGKHRTKTCSLHAISIFFKQTLLVFFQIITWTV